VCVRKLCVGDMLCVSFSSCASLMFLCEGKACVRAVLVTHLLCVGGLEALCCKGCSVVGLCGGGVGVGVGWCWMDAL